MLKVHDETREDNLETAGKAVRDDVPTLDLDTLEFIRQKPVQPKTTRLCTAQRCKFPRTFAPFAPVALAKSAPNTQ